MPYLCFVHCHRDIYNLYIIAYKIANLSLFQSPQSPESWNDVRDATVSLSTKISCQLDQKDGKVTGSEDCLYLNVYTPNITPLEPLPVMFYIHGGGFIYGSGLKEEFGPEYLIENNVVVVSINYRLGVLGFLNLDIAEASGNMGLKDQVKALEWVQRNIHNFGGDKNNVTIFGTSAGSSSVEYLILSPKAKGLFHKAIHHSGASINDWALNYGQSEQITVNLLNKLEYKGNPNDKRGIYEFLLKIPAQQLVAAGFYVTETFTSTVIFFGFVPTIEKDFSDAFLTTLPYKLLRDGNFTKVPMIKGFCEKEGLLMNMMKPFAVKQLLVQKNFTDFFSFKLESGDVQKYNEKYKKAYANAVYSEAEGGFAVDYFGDLHFTAGIWISAKLSAKHNVPTYVFEFTYDGNINYVKRIFGLMVKGATHGDDVSYIFSKNDVVAAPNETDVLVRSRITKMWSNFAKTGFVYS